MTEQMNVPKLRFGEFDGIWLSDRVGNIFDIKAGGDIDKENVSDVRNEKFPYPVFANAEKKKGLYGYSDLYKVDPPCLTVAGRGVNIGIAHARFERFYPIVRLLTLKPKKEQDVKFHEYVFNRLNIFVESTGVPQLTGPQISSYRVALPAHPEQQKIASFLSKVDEKIALLTEKKDKLTEYKKGVMQQLFNGKWEKQGGQLTFIPPTLRFKADDGSEFPDWEERKLGELGQFKNGLNKGKEDFGFGSPFVNLQDVFGKQVISSTSNLGLVNASDKDIDLYQLLKGDVIFIRSSVKKSGVGETALVEKNLVKTVYSGFLIRFRSNTDLTDNYKKYCFWEKRFRNKLIAMSTTSANTNINQESLSQLTIPCPSQDEQTKIANFLSSIDQKIDLTNSELEKAKEWKKGLLQQMFV